jgi:transposase-like protein
VPRYSEERKEAVLRKMLPPHNRPLAELAAEEGISEATLYNWRRDARNQGRLLPDGATGPEGWSAADKFAAVVESAAPTPNSWTGGRRARCGRARFRVPG